MIFLNNLPEGFFLELFILKVYYLGRLASLVSITNDRALRHFLVLLAFVFFRVFSFLGGRLP